MLIRTALISALSEPGQPIFGRSLLERLLIGCERAGLRQMIIEAPREQRSQIETALGRFRHDQRVTIVDSFEDWLSRPDAAEPDAPAIALRGNLVFSGSYLTRFLGDFRDGGAPAAVRDMSVGPRPDGMISVGPLQLLVKRDTAGFTGGTAASDAVLPFALSGRPADSEEAQWRLAREVRKETAAKDAPLARMLDRRVSWRISRRLAQTAIKPNQITIANTLLGLCAAGLFSLPGYWPRLAGSLLFVAVTTLDGVDGEVARLKLSESEFGRALDIGTDAIINFAVFCGLIVGCARAYPGGAYWYVLALFAGGYALCALTSYRAYQVAGPEAERWFKKVDRFTSRDFAYLLVIFAALKWLWFAAWGAAFGSYLFAFLLSWLRPRPEASGTARPAAAAVTPAADRGARRYAAEPRSHPR